MRVTPPLPEDPWARTPADVRAAITALVAAPERRISDLEVRPGQDSTNSSRPPSSDPAHLKRRPPGPPSGRERGGQPGHRRHISEMVPPERLSGVVDRLPPACRRCGGALAGTR